MNNFFGIENYINLLEKGESDFSRNINVKPVFLKTENNSFKKVIFIIHCFVDFILLYVKIFLNKKKSVKENIVFVSPNLCRFNHKSCNVPLTKNLNIQNIIYVNHSKEIYISTIENRKVYNIGGLVPILNNTIFKNKSANCKSVLSHQIINDSFLKKVSAANIYSLCHYDYNGLALAFSNYRKNFTIIEIQHGSMINFYPYQTPANFPIIDTFFVRNNQTIDYLKSHLAKNYNANYYLIPYPKSNLKMQVGVTILYASSIETYGFHDVFLNFLKNNTILNLNIIIRLHPREYHKKVIFENELKKCNIKYNFDESKNWLQANTVENLIVVSPWSSVIEEAIDNGFKSIIIDEIGMKRFDFYINNKSCFYSQDLNKTISNFNK